LFGLPGSHSQADANVKNSQDSALFTLKGLVIGVGLSELHCGVIA
jgi:hypothetical protein